MTETLKKYQEVDAQMKKIVDEINRSDDAKRSNQLSQFLKDAEENLKKMEVRAKELALAYAKLQEKFAEYCAPVAELEVGVEHAIDADELNYVSKRLSDAVKNIGIAERDVMAVHKEMEEILQKYDRLASKVPVAQKQQREAKAAINSLKKEKEAEMILLQKQRTDLEKQLDTQLLEVYQRLRSQKIFPACVSLDANRCGGCRMDISSSLVSKLGTQKFIICENCGRIVTN